MRKYSRKQKIATALGAGAIAVAGAGTAFAFWTSSGSGSGSAAADTPSALVLTGTGASNLYPTGNTSVSVTAKNNNGYPVAFGTHTLTISAVSADAGHSACTATLADLSVDSSANSISSTSEIASGATATVGSIQIDMGDLPSTDQSACEGASFTFTLATA